MAAVGALATLVADTGPRHNGRANSTTGAQPITVQSGSHNQGAICTEDGRKFSNRLELTVSGPGQ